MRRAELQKMKREEAALRQADRESRTDEAQIKLLESGGYGECREVARLKVRIAKREKKENKS